MVKECFLVAHAESAIDAFIVALTDPGSKQCEKDRPIKVSIKAICCTPAPEYLCIQPM